MKNKQNMLQGVTKNIKREETNIGMVENTFDVVECSPNSKFLKLACKLGHNEYKKIYKAKMKLKKDGNQKVDVIWNVVTISSVQQELIDKNLYVEEIEKLKNIHHTNIVKIIDTWKYDDDYVVITEDYKDGTLKDWLKKNGPPQKEKLIYFLMQILEGLKFLHEKMKIVHKNLKLSNIFVKYENGQEILKIGDFGFAEIQFKNKMPSVGTPEFLPREIFEGLAFKPDIDIYALGFLLIQLNTNLWPYDECKGDFELLKKKLFGHLPFAVQKVGDNCIKHFIFRCITTRMDRITLQEMFEHHLLDAKDKCEGFCLPDKPGIVLQLARSKTDFQSTLISIQPDSLHLQLYVPNTEQFIRFNFSGDKETIEDVMREMVDDEIIRSTFYVELLDLFKSSIEKSKKIKSLNAYEEGIFNIGDIEIKQLQMNDRLMLDQTQSYPFIGPKKVKKEQFPPAELAVLEKHNKNNILDIPPCDVSIAGNDVAESSNLNDNVLIQNLQVPEVNENDNQKSLLNENISIEKNDKLGNTINQKIIDQKKDNVEISNPSEMTIEKPLEVENEEHKKIVENKQNCKIIEGDVVKNENDPTYKEPSETKNGSSSPSQKKQFEMIDPAILDKLNIEDFVNQTATIVNRTPEIANEWVKLLKEHEIDTVEDLRLLVEEDWDTLGLPVFAARAMINLLYGKDKQPVKEKHQIINCDIPEYPNDLSIKEFINQICKLVYKPENSSLWEAKLTNQEIRTVGEFKSLHDKDWNKLGLSVFCYRVLKNILNRKGRLPVLSESEI